ncbi:MAG: hypothetical protein RLZZ543_976 [Bacteroidota bacterium]|jgi:peptidoglycan/LPS O-acetylase OafA/YrhL
MSNTRPQNYFENLDATRFLGFFHVFLAHCFFTTNSDIASSSAYRIATVNIRSGFLGLDYFFVLSSFLLTWLALAEWKKTGTFHPGLFMVRRGLRLWPLYFSLILGTYGLVALLGEQLGISTLPPISVFLLFVSNFWIAFQGQDFLFLLVFFWSIAVEEQFYLVWAMVLRYLHRYLVPVSLVMIAVSVWYRATHLEQEAQLYFHTLSYLGNFGIGALTAHLAFNKPAFLERVKTMPRWFIVLTYLALAILTAGYFRWFQTPFMVIIEKLVFGFFFAFLILEQCYAEHSFFKLGRLKRIGYLGQLSLGLYCFHGVVLTFALPYLKAQGWADQAWQVFFLNPLLIFLATLVLAQLSHSLIEAPIHRLRKHFYPKTSSSTSGV